MGKKGIVMILNFLIDNLEQMVFETTPEPVGMTLDESRRYWFRCGIQKAIDLILESEIKRVREYRANPEVRARDNERRRLRQSTPEERAREVEMQRIRRSTPEGRERLREWRRKDYEKKKSDPEFLAKQRAAQAKFRSTPEGRARVNAYQRKAYAKKKAEKDEKKS